MCTRSVLITGAASGLGLATAERMMESGWHVVAADWDEAALADLAGRAAARSLTSCPLDVTDGSSIRNAAEVCRALKAPLKAVVNCAGTAQILEFMNLTPEVMRSTYEINVIGAAMVSQALIPSMQAAGGGAIVHISSVSGMRGSYGRSAYGASKAALNHLTCIMASELAEDGIRVNAVAPGPVDTPLTRVAHTQQTRDEWNRVLPMRRYGSVDEVASAIEFLADEHRSSFITGQILAVDGGFTSAGLMS